MIKELIDAIKASFGAKAALSLLLLVVVVSVLWSLYVFAQSSFRESRKPFLELQLSLCKEVVGYTSTIASSNSADEKRTAIDKFWQLYHGGLVIVENDELSRAMVNFAQNLKPDVMAEVDQLSFPQLYARPINQAALRVAGACRDLIKSGWAYDLLPWFSR